MDIYTWIQEGVESVGREEGWVDRETLLTFLSAVIGLDYGGDVVVGNSVSHWEEEDTMHLTSVTNNLLGFMYYYVSKPHSSPPNHHYVRYI